MLKKNKKIIYYRASNEENNNGEGFLAVFCKNLKKAHF